jgi:hypothetical protein
MRPQQSGIECVTRMGVTSNGPMRTGLRMSSTWKLFFLFVFGFDSRGVIMR